MRKPKLLINNIPKEDILKLVAESGYLMEQRIAKRLEDLTWEVSQSYNYQDQDEQKSREIDILATRTAKNQMIDLSVKIELIIECKGEPSPLIVFPRISDNLSKLSFNNMFAGSIAKFIKNDNPYKEPQYTQNAQKINNWFINIKKTFLAYLTKGISIGSQACTINEKKKNKADTIDDFYLNNETFYEALLSLIKASQDRKQQYFTGALSQSDDNLPTIICPVLIWHNELYRYEHDSPSGTLIDIPFIPFYHSHRSGKIQGDFLIYIVKEDSLDKFSNIMKNNKLAEFLLVLEEYLKSIKTNNG